MAKGAGRADGRPRTCSIRSQNRVEKPLSLLEWRAVRRRVLQHVFSRSLLGALQLPLLLLFFLTLPGELLLTLLEPVISLWQKCSLLVKSYHSSRPSSSRKAATATSDGMLGDSLNA